MTTTIITNTNFDYCLPHISLAESPDKKKVSITALALSQGLIWIGSSTGHILTIPVAVSNLLHELSSAELKLLLQYLVYCSIFTYSLQHEVI